MSGLTIAESASYEFHSGGLLLTSSALRRPRAGDALALGLVAEVDNAVLIRVEFLATSDYIQIEIVSLYFELYSPTSCSLLDLFMYIIVSDSNDSIM